MRPRPLFIANWKMFLVESDVSIFLNRFKPLVFEAEDRDIVIAPSFASLRTAAILTERSRIRIGAQDLFPETEGAFTGAVSGPMLAAVGCRFVLVGHSERRHHFGEDDDLVRRKLHAALAHRLRPVLCVGETAAERQAGQAAAVVERQVGTALDGIETGEAPPLEVAYEPVWAIGTGDNATPEQAEGMHQEIRRVLRQRLPGPAGEGVRILYGGSVTPENAAALMARPAVQGLLVGGASRDPDAFAAICSVPVPSASAGTA